MHTIPAEEIKRRGISALDEMLKEGPVQVIKNNRPRYVVMTEEDYARLTERRGLWELLDRPARGTRSKKDIDVQLRAERDAWGAARRPFSWMPASSSTGSKPPTPFTLASWRGCAPSGSRRLRPPLLYPA